MSTNSKSFCRFAVVGLIGFCVASTSSTTSAGELYGSDVSTQSLYLIDRDTGDVDQVGPFGDLIMGMAHDVNHDVTYGISANADAIFKINRATGRASIIGGYGTLGVDNANGLAYDPNHDILYATDNNTNTLLTVNVNTGVGTVIANITNEFREIEGLAYDPETDTLYGLSGIDDYIIAIDVTTGDAVAVSDRLEDYVWRGLTFDTERRVIYATNVDPYGNPDPNGFWEFDPDTGTLRMIAELVGPGAVQGLAFVPEAGNEFTLEITGGNCPGLMELCVRGADPRDRIAVVYGFKSGTTGPVPGCGGLTVEIANAKLFKTGRADADGSFCLSGKVPAGACGRTLVQAINLSACTVSNVVKLQ